MSAFCPSYIPYRTTTPHSLQPVRLPHAHRSHYSRCIRARRPVLRRPLQTPRACVDPADIPEQVRDVSLVTVNMTAGGDVLFPGSSQSITLSNQVAMRLLENVCESNPPEFGHLSINAWGDPASIGTLAVVDNLTLEGANSRLACTGLKRFNVLHLAEDHSSARIELFHDETPSEEDNVAFENLEKQLVDAMSEIVRLSIKLSHDADEARQQLLQNTLKRVEAFYYDLHQLTGPNTPISELDLSTLDHLQSHDPEQEEHGEEEEQHLSSAPLEKDAEAEPDSDAVQSSAPAQHHWLTNFNSHRRRELLSFIVIDMLSISFMDRKNVMKSTNTGERLAEALSCLEPFVKELAAKGAIVSALGRQPELDDNSSQISPN